MNKENPLSLGYIAKNIPDDCCCRRFPEKFHYHYTLDSVLKRNNKTCELCDIYMDGYHFHYKGDCCQRG